MWGKGLDGECHWPTLGIVVCLLMGLVFCPVGPGQALARAGEQPVRILFIGDSITSGMGVVPEAAYPKLIERELRARGIFSVRIINGSISGSTTAGAYSRINWYLKANPHILVLALGANDGLRGLSTREMEKNLEKAIVLARENGILVILAGMEVPPNYGPEYARDFARVYMTLARVHGVALIPFLLKDVAGQRDLNQADGIHPNSHGHEIIAATVMPYILEQLNRRDDDS